MRLTLIKFLSSKIGQADTIRLEKEISESHQKFKNLQLKFQKNDGLPIFLKGGQSDKALFLTTMALSGLGLFETFRFIIGKAFKTKVEAKVEAQEISPSPALEEPAVVKKKECF